MGHIFCCANISKHKYKLYARSSRTNSEIIGIIRPISTHRHSFVHQGRLAIFFQSQPDFSIHRRFCLKCYTIAPRSWHINHLIKLRRPSIGKCSRNIGNKALFSSINGICTPVFCPSRPACKIVHEIAICYNIIRKRNECYIIKRYRKNPVWIASNSWNNENPQKGCSQHLRKVLEPLLLISISCARSCQR